jgi:hypothetical protein
MMKLIDEARHWWRMWSIRAAAIFATVLAAIAANPAPVLVYLGSLPDAVKPWIPVLTLVVTFGVPTLLRLWKQGPHEKPDEAE